MKELKVTGKTRKNVNFLVYFHSILWLLTMVLLFLLNSMQIELLLVTVIVCVCNILYFNLENSYLTIDSEFICYERNILFIKINKFRFDYQNMTFCNDKIFVYGIKNSLYMEFDWRMEDASSIKLVSKKFKVEIYIDSENESIFEEFIESIKKIEKPD